MQQVEAWLFLAVPVVVIGGLVVWFIVEAGFWQTMVALYGLFMYVMAVAGMHALGFGLEATSALVFGVPLVGGYVLFKRAEAGHWPARRDEEDPKP
jgi:hypothetical protein